VGANAHAQHRERDDSSAGAADCCTDIAAAFPYTLATEAIFADPIRSHAVSTIASIIASILANTQFQQPGDPYAADDRRPVL
jgi:hypothetical protein